MWRGQPFQISSEEVEESIQKEHKHTYNFWTKDCEDSFLQMSEIGGAGYLRFRIEGAEQKARKIKGFDMKEFETWKVEMTEKYLKDKARQTL